MIAVLAIGLVVAGAGYFLTTRASSASDVPSAKPAPADSSQALIDPPGAARAGGGSFPLAALRSTVSLPQAVVDALTAGGMTEGLLKTTDDNGVTIDLYALTVRGEPDAGAVAQAYGTAQQQAGLSASKRLSMAGVPVYGTVTGVAHSRYCAAYVLYNRVILVESTGSDQAGDVFSRVLRQQVDLAPPTIRAP